MKTITLKLDSSEHERMKKARDKTSYTNWEKFILSKCCKGISVKRNGNKIL